MIRSYFGIVNNSNALKKKSESFFITSELDSERRFMVK